MHNKVLKYANLVNSLRTEAGGYLDVLAACGDYTSTGSLVEAQGVASAFKGILSQMPETKFTFCYGNHDTCWGGNLPISANARDFEALKENGRLTKKLLLVDATVPFYIEPNAILESLKIYPVSSGDATQVMGPTAIDDGEGTVYIPGGNEIYNYVGKIDYTTGLITPITTSEHYAYANVEYDVYETWESLLQQNNILSAENVPVNLLGEGVYRWNIQGGNIVVIGLETLTYAPNIYSNNVLSWLDAELANLTSDTTCIILSHAPIMESGVFGSDPNLDNNAVWAAVDKDENENVGALHNILKKYNNVYYFSGHTHRIPMINSHIMSNGYTALNVGSFYGSNLFAVRDATKGKDIYVDNPSTDSISGISTALLVEIDETNQIRIKRVFTRDFGGVTGTYNNSNDSYYELTNISFGNANYNKPYLPWIVQ